MIRKDSSEPGSASGRGTRNANYTAMRLFAASVLLSSLSLALSASAQAQSALKVEHGLTIPNTRTPWAVDTFQDQAQLVPVHHSTIAVNRHNGANIAGSLAGSFFYKPKLTTELDGLNARTQLHSKTPIFYLLNEFDDDPGGQQKDSVTASYAIVKVVQAKNRRIMDTLSFTQLTGNAKHVGTFIEATSTKTPDGWVRIEPKSPMEEGEYCILPIPSVKGSYSTVVFDFGITLGAPNAKDAIVANGR